MVDRGGSRPCLGIILPDDPVPLEMVRLGSWLAGKGRGDVDAVTLRSVITGGHTEAVLLEAGDIETIGPVGRALADTGCGAVVWACTSGSFIGGYDWARAQAQGLAARAGCPATSTTLSFIAALAALGVDAVDVLAAYPEPVTRAFIDCLGAAGVRVLAWEALDSPDGAASFHLPLEEIVARFAKTSGSGVPILVPDTAIDTLDRIAALEAETGRMVLTANQVSLWHGLTLLGADTAIEGAGAFFLHEE